MGQASGVCVPAFCPHSPSLEQTSDMQGDSSNPHRPFWPQKEWFPELLSLSVAPPVPLPLRRDLLKQPHFHRLHQNLHMLHLHAWRLFSNSLPLRPVSWCCEPALFMSVSVIPLFVPASLGSAIELGAPVGAILFRLLPLPKLRISCCFFARTNIFPSPQLKGITLPSFPCSNIACPNFWIALSSET